WLNKNVAETQAASESELFAVQNLDATNLAEIAGAYEKVSAGQVGKPAAQRALILSAKTWLEAENYEKAQASFKNYLGQHGDGFWADEAKLGHAICQEETDAEADVISTYQSLTNSAKAIIKDRATSLLEASQKKLDPLVAKPKPAPLPPAEVAKPAVPVVPPALAAPDNK
ncbi:MAG: hypothetical protein ACJ06V_13530, partial [Verrucomicrobiota bacterium]